MGGEPSPGETQILPFTRNEAQIRGLRQLSVHWTSGAERFWSFDEVLDALGRPGSIGFFAATGPEASWRGVILADVGPYSVDLLYVFVHPDWRRGGLGRRLLERLVVELGGRPEIEALFLEVRASNAAAQDLYAALGMQIIGRRRSYYRDGEDALVYKLDFPR